MLQIFVQMVDGAVWQQHCKISFVIQTVVPVIDAVMTHVILRRR